MIATGTGYLAVLLALLLWSKRRWGLLASYAALQSVRRLLQTATTVTPGRRVLSGTLQSDKPLIDSTGDAVIYLSTAKLVIDGSNSESASVVGSEFDRQLAPCVLQTSSGPVQLDLKESHWQLPDQFHHRHTEPSWMAFSHLAPELAKRWSPEPDRGFQFDETTVAVGAHAYVSGQLSLRPPPAPAAASDPPQLHLTAPPGGKVTLSERSPGQVLAQHQLRLAVATLTTALLTLYTTTLLAWLFL